MQLSAWPTQPVLCSTATSGLTSASSMEQWELSKPSATGQEAHLTFPSLSWSTLTATLAPPSLTAPSPSLLFAAAGPPQEEASAHDSSCPSSWRGLSPSTSHRVSPWTRWSSTSARESSPQASHSSPALVSISCKICSSPHHSPSSASPPSPTAVGWRRDRKKTRGSKPSTPDSISPTHPLLSR